MLVMKGLPGDIILVHLTPAQHGQAVVVAIVGLDFPLVVVKPQKVQQGKNQPAPAPGDFRLDAEGLDIVEDQIPARLVGEIGRAHV